MQYGGLYSDRPWIFIPPYGEIPANSMTGAASPFFITKTKVLSLQLDKDYIEPNLPMAKAKILLYRLVEFKELNSLDQLNCQILVSNLKNAPLKCLKTKELVRRLLRAYIENIAIHTEAIALSKVDSKPFDLHRALLRSSMRRIKSKNTTKRVMARGIFDRYREVQIELHYLCSRAAVQKVFKNLGYEFTRDCDLEPRYNSIPYLN